MIQHGLETQDDVTHTKTRGEADMDGMQSEGNISVVALNLLHILKSERLVHGNGLVRMSAVTRLYNSIRGTSYASLENCRAITNGFTK